MQENLVFYTNLLRINVNFKIKKVNRNSNHTIGVEFGSKIFRVNDENIKL